MLVDRLGSDASHRGQSRVAGWTGGLILLLLVLPGVAQGQTDLAQHWEPFRYFSGLWDGTETGALGVGTGDRVYAFIMDETYLMALNTSNFDQQEANPAGEVHEDYSIFSYDGIRNKIVLREFHSEGFVNQYVLASLEGDAGSFIFESESIENLPPGSRARLTLTILGPDEFEELFELAEPGGEYGKLLRNHFTRR